MGDFSSPSPAKKIRFTVDDSDPNSENGIQYSKELQTDSETEKLDPVIEHMLELKKFYFAVKKIIFEFEEKEKQQEEERQRNLMYPPKKVEECPTDILNEQSDEDRLRSHTLPPIPERYPFSETHEDLLDLQKNKVQVKLKSQLKEVEVEQIIKDFVKKLLTLTGFYVHESDENIKIDEEPISYLTLLTHTYLKKISQEMWKITSCRAFSKSDDLWVPLEKALHKMKCSTGICKKNPNKVAFEENVQTIESSNIATLHAFYFENIVKKYNALYGECEKMEKFFQTRKNSQVHFPHDDYS